jgi:hypothetical protein|tara:strand:- start:4 stop:603 length:600 start_codon:yes stop_codon:yes gene_type:complete
VGQNKLEGTNEMATTKRTKPDEFMAPDLYCNSVADGIHHAIMPLDKIATDLDMKWGVDRLPSLVSSQTAALFGSAKAKLDAAIQSNIPADVVARVEIMIRGWEKLDDEATERGHQPLSPDIWTYSTPDGFKIAVARSDAEAMKGIREDKRLAACAVYSLSEIALIMKSQTLLNQTKAVFPEATVKSVSNKSLPDDEIPF